MSIASIPSGAGRRNGRRYLVHPSRRRLVAWLDGDEHRLDDHLADCARCADLLTTLAPDTPSLSQALRRVLAPPQDLDMMLRRAVEQRMQDKDDLHLLTSMLGVPIETLRSLSPPDQDD